MKSSVFLILLLVLVIVFMAGCDNKSPKICYNEDCFNVEIAKTVPEMTKGLMDRIYLDSDKGMIFLYEEEGIYSFWMKNTKISLDIIWIKADQEVVYVQRDTVPCEEDPCLIYSSDKPAKYVLEIKGGLADEIGLTEGDYLEFYNI